MTDHLHSLTVVFDKDMREDDAECIINAIQMIKGVQTVHLNVSGPEIHAVVLRERTRIERQIFEAIHKIIQGL